MASADRSDFGTLLRLRRVEAGLTQEELAELAGLSVRGIRALELGERSRPYRDTIQLLAGALRLSEEDREAFDAAARHQELSTLVVDSFREADSKGTLVRTFMIADIRGYTPFTEEHGDEAAARLSAKFALVAHEKVAERGATLVEVRGDEVLAVFTSTRQALRAAVELQERFTRETAAVAALPLKVGIGLDAGEAIPVEGGYRGGALNLAARLCSLAGPGEILASASVTHLAGKVPVLMYVDRGVVELKGLSNAVQVMQIAPKGKLAAELPPLEPVVRSRPTNLPDPATSFIGRELEIAAVSELLQRPGVRLVTLTGAGGAGKTRLAIQAGATLLYEFRDGVFLVSLASIADPDLVASAIAQTLGVRATAGGTQVERLMAHLQRKHLLLVLDNFEHLLDAGLLIGQLLDACPRIKVMVTSRAVLHLSHEHRFEVLPFSVPSSDELPEVAHLSRYESVALFTRRAQAAVPTFALSSENARDVVEICRRLDGLALAIELAAARTRIFPPRALLARLSHPLEILTHGPRDVLDRHQSLRGTLDWSYSLLDAEEQRLFSRLAVFSGGCTLAAVEAVCNAGGRDVDVLDKVASLVDSSLLGELEGPEGDPRFSMLETVREYAAERLERTGEAGATGERHAAYYHALAEEAGPELKGIEHGRWLERLEADHNNLRAALRWTIDSGNSERALRFAVALWSLWREHGHYSEARKWLHEVLALPDGAPSYLRVRALRFAGGMARAQGDFGEAEQLLETSLALAKNHGDISGAAAALSQLGILAAHTGDYVEAATFLERAVGLARELGEQDRVAEFIDNLGAVLVYQGDLVRAARLFEESLAIYRELGYEAHVADVLRDLGSVVLQQGDLERARRLMRESLSRARESGAAWVVIFGLEVLCRAVASLGQPEKAVRMWAAVEALSGEVGISFPDAERILHDRYLSAARDQLDESVFACAWEEGRVMTLQQAVSYALCAED